jgi:hypothetical protein
LSLARRLFPWSPPRHLGPTMLLLVSAAGVFAVFWGYFNPPAIRVVLFDAGTLDRFAIHRVVAYPEQDLYVVGMGDGRIRAIDGRVQPGDCRVEWLPEDQRGAVRNPNGLPGVYRDPCTGALWSFEGNAISGTDRPLRTPKVAVRAGENGGTQHVFVELVNPSR